MCLEASVEKLQWQGGGQCFLHRDLTFLFIQGKENTLNNSHGNTSAAALNFVRAFPVVFHNILPATVRTLFYSR